MSDEKMQIIGVTGVVVLAVAFIGGLFVYSTTSYWQYHRELLKEGKVLIHMPQHDVLENAR